MVEPLYETGKTRTHEREQPLRLHAQVGKSPRWIWPPAPLPAVLNLCHGTQGPKATTLSVAHPILPTPFLNLPAAAEPRLSVPLGWSRDQTAQFFNGRNDSLTPPRPKSAATPSVLSVSPTSGQEEPE